MSVEEDASLDFVRAVIKRARKSGDPRAAYHPHGSRTVWTEEKLTLLRTLWAAGMTCSAIAAAVGGITKNSVIGKAHRLELPPRQSPRRGIVFHRQPARERARPHSLPVSPRLPAMVPKSAVFKIDAPYRNEVPAVSPECNPVSILGRTELQCSYITGDNLGPDTLMCGAPVQRHSLCAFHVALCWQPRPKKASNPNGTTRRSSLIHFIGEAPFG
jgi:GcrA cell cycle regulator